MFDVDLHFNGIEKVSMGNAISAFLLATVLNGNCYGYMYECDEFVIFLSPGALSERRGSEQSRYEPSLAEQSRA